MSDVEKCPMCYNQDFAIVRDMTSRRVCKCGYSWDCPKKEPTPTYVYISKEDLGRIYRGCDLGDSVGVRVYQYPHKDQIPMLVKFVIQSDYDKLKADYDSLVSGDILEHESASFRILKDEHNKLEQELASAKELIEKLNDVLLDIRCGQDEKAKTYSTADMMRKSIAAISKIKQWEAGK